MHHILVIHGPNLNLLGQRESKHYGHDTLDTINKRLQALATTLNLDLRFFQSNAEHQLIDAVQQATHENTNLILFNPAAFTHTSVALRDALLAVKIPFIEVHLSTLHAREDFRQRSFFSDIALGTISGLGSYSYDTALQAAYFYLHSTPHQRSK